MKPLFCIHLKARDPMDPTTIEDIGTIEVSSIGDVTVILTRDQMGVSLIETSEVAAQPGFVEQLKEAAQTLKELHEQLGRTQVAANFAMTDMFAIHKWMTR